MPWSVPNMGWEEVWILGGGPSLTQQFDIPESVVQKVVSKTFLPNIYSPYMSAIHNKHVIGINIAFAIGDWIDMMFFGDSSFFLANKDKIAEFPGLKVSCHDMMEKHSWLKYIPADKEKKYGINNNPGKVCWNYNSGAAAISVAANAGAKRIILVGFDMKLNNTVKHWHNHYGSINSDPTQSAAVFDRHLLGFSFIKKDADARGIEILNACPDSAIKEFKKVTVKELL